MSLKRDFSSHQKFTAEMAQSAHVSSLNTEWKEVFPLATLYKFSKHAIIPHEKHQGIYYLVSGKVVLTYTSVNGLERTALYFGPDTLFNEARAFSGYNPSGRFSCLTDVEVYFFPSELIMSIDFIVKYPHLIQNLISTMGAKTLLHYIFLSEMGTGSVSSHLCRLILSLSTNNGNKSKFPSNMTQQEVADLLGVHRTTLARALRRLRSDGVINKFTHGEIVISNYKLLRDCAMN